MLHSHYLSLDLSWLWLCSLFPLLLWDPHYNWYVAFLSPLKIPFIRSCRSAPKLPLVENVMRNNIQIRKPKIGIWRVGFMASYYRILGRSRLDKEHHWAGSLLISNTIVTVNIPHWPCQSSHLLNEENKWLPF